MRFIWQKTQKTSNVGNIRTYDEEKFFFEEKTFSFFKIASLPNWEGANMPVVAGRLVNADVELLPV